MLEVLRLISGMASLTGAISEKCFEAESVERLSLMLIGAARGGVELRKELRDEGSCDSNCWDLDRAAVATVLCCCCGVAVACV